MAERTVKVKLLAEHAQFEAAMRSAGQSTENLSDKMKKALASSDEFSRALNGARSANLQLTAATRAAADAQKKAAEAAKAAARANAEAGVAAEDAAMAAEKLERGEISKAEAQKLAKNAAQKDRDAQLANAEAQRLAADAAQKVERASLRAAAAQMAQGKLAKTAGKELAEAAKDSRSIFSKGLSSALGAVGDTGPLVAVLVGAVAAAAPFAAAALGGALVAGIGTAGIGAAVAGQINSPGVRGAFGHLADTAKQELNQVTSGFEVPLEHAAAIFENALRENSTTLQTFFDTLAPDVERLAQGLADFLSNILTSAPEVAEAFRPLVAVISNELPRLGNDIAGFLEATSSDSQGLADALIVVFALISGAIKMTGAVIQVSEALVNRFMTSIIGALAILSKIPGPLQDTFGSSLRGLQKLTDATGPAARGIDTFGNSAADATDDTKALNDALKAQSDQFDSLVNSALAASDADLAFRDALAEVTKTAQANGTSLDANTAAGRKNIEMFNDLISKAESSRQANIANGMSIEDANSKFYSQVAAIDKAAASAGYNTRQLNIMIASMFRIPHNVATRVGLYGAKSAKQQVDALRYAMDMLHNKLITITTQHVAVYRTDRGGRALVDSNADGGIRDFRAYADGGFSEPAHVASIVPAGTMRLMAEPETGGEAYIPLAQSKRTRSLAIWRETGKRLGIPVNELAPTIVNRSGGSAPSAGAIASALAAQLDAPLREVAAAVMADKHTSFKVGGLEFARAVEATTRYRKGTG